MDRSINRASASEEVSPRAFGVPSSPRSGTGALVIAAIPGVRLETRFQGPGRHRRPIHAMLGDDRPRSSCSFRRR